MADMKEIVIYVHGKGGSAEEAGHYRSLCPDAEVVGFDYRAQSPWETEAEFPPFFAAQRKRCDRLTLIANSIGAFFSMSALDAALVDRAYWISPVVDMEKLIGDMLQWAGVREQELAEKQEIPSLRRNAVMEVSDLRAGASDRVACAHPHFVRRARRSDLAGNHLGLYQARRRRPDRHAGRRALVPHGRTTALSGRLDHGRRREMRKHR